jgi:hypothetical protein
MDFVLLEGHCKCDWFPSRKLWRFSMSCSFTMVDVPFVDSIIKHNMDLHILILMEIRGLLLPRFTPIYTSVEVKSQIDFTKWFELSVHLYILSQGIVELQLTTGHRNQFPPCNVGPHAWLGKLYSFPKLIWCGNLVSPLDFLWIKRFSMDLPATVHGKVLIWLSCGRLSMQISILEAFYFIQILQINISLHQIGFHFHIIIFRSSKTFLLPFVANVRQAHASLYNSCTFTNFDRSLMVWLTS